MLLVAYIAGQDIHEAEGQLLMAQLGNSVESSRGRNVVYWVTPAILGTECIVGGIMWALRLPPFIGVIQHLVTQPIS
jgi:hypothetical protein